MVWSPLATAKVCWAWGAAFQLALPAWLASMTQVPTVVKLTVEPEMEQNEVALASMVKATARPELDAAVTMEVEPPTFAPAGAVVVEEMVWSPLVTAKNWST